MLAQLKTFRANKEVLDARCHILDTPRPQRVSDFKAREKSKDDTLPKREKQDGFGALKPGHGVERQLGASSTRPSSKTRTKLVHK